MVSARADAVPANKSAAMSVAANASKAVAVIVMRTMRRLT